MGVVRLLEVDAILAGAIPASERALACSIVTVARRTLEPGPWEPIADPEATAGMLVLEGLLARDVLVAGRRSRQLLGAGHFLGPESGPPALLPASVSWFVLERTTVALLGQSWIASIRRWPQLAVGLQQRATDYAERLATNQAISQLPRIEDRVLAILLHLADDWGRVTPAGIVVDLHLTHKDIGQLVGARRPTVSLALAMLAAAGAVRRHEGGWLIDPEAAATWSDMVDGQPAPRRGR
jgi:hypothetical protein